MMMGSGCQADLEPRRLHERLLSPDLPFPLGVLVWLRVLAGHDRVLAPAVVLSCAVAEQLIIPGVPFPLSPSSAGLWRLDEAAGAAGAVTVSAQPHTDTSRRASPNGNITQH